MKLIPIAVLVVVVATFRIRRFRKHRAGGTPRAHAGFGPFNSDIALVAAREIRERFRGKIFRVGTLIILAVVAAAIIIPTLGSSGTVPEKIGVVGPLSTSARTSILTVAKSAGTRVHFVHESDAKVANRALRAGTLDIEIVDGEKLVVNRSIGATSSSTTANLTKAIAMTLGDSDALAAARLSTTQIKILTHAKPIPVRSLHHGTSGGGARTTSVVGLILVFIMLTQYNTWILMGVMEEKSSRVIEVLLATVRPIRLLAGKVLGIGLVALAQAATIVIFALILAAGVGSNLLNGAAPTVLAATFVWLVLGYAFYCWVYAAAGSLAERQAQVQSMALPLNIPIVFGYIMALTTASSGNPSIFFKVLAYLPITAPFAMPVLVGLKMVSMWDFLASVAITIVCTIGVARLASGIYRRAILSTGKRIKLRELYTRSAGSGS